VAGPVLFVVAFTVAGMLRPGRYTSPFGKEQE
jgi:hypothetical protein